MTDYYSNLPYDTLYEIAMELPIRDVLNQCNASKRLNEICKNQQFWSKRTEQDFGLNAVDWKQFYINSATSIEKPSSYWLQTYINEADPDLYPWKERYIDYLKSLDRPNSYWQNRYIDEVDPDFESWKDNYIKYIKEDKRNNLYWRDKFDNTFKDLNINWRLSYFNIMNLNYRTYVNNLVAQINNTDNINKKYELTKEYYVFLVKNKDILDLPEFKEFKRIIMNILRELFIENRFPYANEYYYKLFGRRLYTLPTTIR